MEVTIDANEMLALAARIQRRDEDMRNRLGRTIHRIHRPEIPVVIEALRLAAATLSPQQAPGRDISEQRIAELEADIEGWIAYADKLEKILELVCAASRDKLQQIHAQTGLQLVRP